MCYSWKKWVTLRKCITGGKTNQALKYVLQFTLKNCVTVAKFCHTLSHVSLLKKWVTLKNVSQLKKCVVFKKCATFGKMGQT